MTSRKPTPGLFIDYGLYLLVRFLEFVVVHIPERWAYAIGRGVGRLIGVLIPDRLDAARENLTIAFGKEKS
jgi:lauroyl/myristoyl acyltransferase